MIRRGAALVGRVDFWSERKVYKGMWAGDELVSVQGRSSWHLRHALHGRSRARKGRTWSFKALKAGPEAYFRSAWQAGPLQPAPLAPVGSSLQPSLPATLGRGGRERPPGGGSGAASRPQRPGTALESCEHPFRAQTELVDGGLGLSVGSTLRDLALEPM